MRLGQQLFGDQVQQGRNVNGKAGAHVDRWRMALRELRQYLAGQRQL